MSRPVPLFNNVSGRVSRALHAASSAVDSAEPGAGFEAVVSAVSSEVLHTEGPFEQWVKNFIGYIVAASRSLNESERQQFEESLANAAASIRGGNGASAAVARVDQQSRGFAFAAYSVWAAGKGDEGFIQFKKMDWQQQLLAVAGMALVLYVVVMAIELVVTALAIAALAAAAAYCCGFFPGQDPVTSPRSSSPT